MQTTRTLAVGICAAIEALASACGGGDDSTIPPASLVAPPTCPAHSFPCPAKQFSAHPDEPIAIFDTTIAGFPSPDMLYVYLDGGHQLAIVGRAGSAGFSMEDLITVTLGSWSLASEPGMTYNSLSWLHGTDYSIHAQANPSGISGTMASRGMKWTFSGSDALRHSSYRFSQPASPSALAGAWSMTSLHGDPLLIEIDDAGVVSGTYLGCALAGTAHPSSTRNYFAVAITLLGSCTAQIPATFKGFLMVVALDGGRVQVLLHASASWSDGWEGMFLLASGIR